MIIDARGIGCPKPVIMAEEELAKIAEGIVEILVDNEASVRNLERFAKKNAYYAESQKNDGYWQVKIVKSYPCEVPEGSGEKGEGDKDLLLIVGTESMGEDKELGKVLMKGFFETMRAYKELPHTIFFLNTGVKLTATEGDILPVIKGIEALGVEIYSCGTCLKHFNLESELKVGHRGTTNHIVEGMKDFKKTVWIG